MSPKQRLVVYAVSTLSFLPSAAAHSQQTAYQDPSWQKYQTIVQTADLQTRPNEPYILKLDYQLYDLEGNPTSKGTVEKVWGQTADPHTVIDSPTLQMNDAESADKLVQHHNRESYLVHQVLSAFVRPELYSARRLDFMLSRVRRAVGGVDLACLNIGLAGQEVPRTETFCMDADGNLQTIQGDGPFQIDRTNFVAYRNTKVPTDISISYRGKVAIRAHASTLTALTASETAVAADPNDSPVVPGQVLARVGAAYPIAAKLSHASGLVILTALITKDGHTAGIDVISSPSAALSKSAMEAVKKWTYSAYKRNGEPAVVEETMTVDFSLISN